MGKTRYDIGDGVRVNGTSTFGVVDEISESPKGTLYLVGFPGLRGRGHSKWFPASQLRLNYRWGEFRTRSHAESRPKRPRFPR